MTARLARKAAWRAAVIAAATALAASAWLPLPARANEALSVPDAAASECTAKKKPSKAKSRSKKSSKAKSTSAGDTAAEGRVTKDSVAPRPRPTPGANPAQLDPAGTALLPDRTPAPPAPSQMPAQAPIQTPGGPFVPAQMDPQNPNRQPDYPLESRSLGEQGRVVLWVEILADGNVGRAMIATSSLSPRLDAAALAAARTWHYIPATRGGVAVTSGANVLVDFKLSN